MFFQHRGNDFRKGGKAEGMKCISPLRSSSAGRTLSLHGVLKQNKIARAGGQKAQKGTLGPGGRLRGGEDCSRT